jgi:hypothetical protein
MESEVWQPTTAEVGMVPMTVIVLVVKSPARRAFNLPSDPLGIGAEVGQTKPGREEALLDLEQDTTAVSVVWARIVMVALVDVHELRVIWYER